MPSIEIFFSNIRGFARFLFGGFLAVLLALTLRKNSDEFHNFIASMTPYKAGFLIAIAVVAGTLLFLVSRYILHEIALKYLHKQIMNPHTREEFAVFLFSDRCPKELASAFNNGWSWTHCLAATSLVLVSECLCWKPGCLLQGCVQGCVLNGWIFGLIAFVGASAFLCAWWQQTTVVLRQQLKALKAYQKP